MIEKDDDKNPKINFSKPIDYIVPTNHEEAKTMILGDISTICEALCFMIHLADQNNYFKKQDLVDKSIEFLKKIA